MLDENGLEKISNKEFFTNKIFVESYSVKLKFKFPIKFNFYHGSKLYAFVSNLIGFHSTPAQKQKVNDIVLYPCESGRINYNIGDEYIFQITFLNNRRDIIEKFKENIRHIPEFAFSGDLNKDSVELIELKPVEFPEYNNDFKNVFTLNFLTPLRIERKEEDKRKGQTLFDTKYFDGKHFFKLLYKRAADLYKLNTGSFPFAEVPPTPEVEVIDKYFIWIDSPKEGNKLTLGGIQGYVKFNAELDELWKRILYFGQIMHAGKHTSAGFGKYIINGSEFSKTIIKPTKSLFQISSNKGNIISALNHIKANSDSSKIDNITPENFNSNFQNIAAELINKLNEENYNSEPLKGIISPDHFYFSKTMM